MSCIVLGFEFAEINVYKELGVFIDENDQRYSFRPPKKNTKPQTKHFGVQILH